MSFEVANTPELRRVLALPQRDWEVEIKKNDLYLRMTQHFKMPQGDWSLEPLQAAALAEAHDLRGLFLGANCGDGKTLISYLLPTVVQNIHRPLLVVPGGLVKKTWRDFQELHTKFVSHPAWLNEKRCKKHVVGYETLSREGGDAFLANARPDMIILDEGHCCASITAACTQKVNRFRLAFPETVYCDMSGTPTNRSIMEYWHRLYWTLKERMPLPRVKEEAELWADVLDEKKTSVIGKRGIGALQLLLPPEKRNVQIPRTAPVGRTQQMPELFFWDQIKDVREGYQKRLTSSPGVVFSKNDKRPAASLQIRTIDLEPGPRAKEHLHELRKNQMTPLGTLIKDPRQIWRWARMLSTGFYYYWDPPPPREWLDARGTWNFTLREILLPDGSLYNTYRHLNLDSAFQVALAITGSSRSGVDLHKTAEACGIDIENLPDGVELEDVRDEDGKLLSQSKHAVHYTDVRPPKITDKRIVDAYREWAAVRHIYKIQTKPQWLDDTVPQYCAQWMKNAGSGIIWTEHIAFGERVSQLLGIPFCSENGEDKNGKAIEDYRGAPVVASVPGNYKGRNLHDWHKCLVVSMMPSGKWAEQLHARTHRRRQRADRVYWDHLMLCDEQRTGFEQMFSDARYIYQTTNLPQRILYADVV
jgi:hypothetical protein